MFRSTAGAHVFTFGYNASEVLATTMLGGTLQATRIGRAKLNPGSRSSSPFSACTSGVGSKEPYLVGNVCHCKHPLFAPWSAAIEGRVTSPWPRRHAAGDCGGFQGTSKNLRCSPCVKQWYMLPVYAAASTFTDSSGVSKNSGLTSANRGEEREGSPTKLTRMADFLLSDTPVAIEDFGTLSKGNWWSAFCQRSTNSLWLSLRLTHQRELVQGIREKTSIQGRNMKRPKELLSSETDTWVGGKPLNRAVASARVPWQTSSFTSHNRQGPFC